MTFGGNLSTVSKPILSFVLILICSRLVCLSVSYNGPATRQLVISEEPIGSDTDGSQKTRK